MKQESLILAKEGFLSIAPDYRQEFGVDQYPTNVEDVACSIAWAKAHAQEYGADPTKVLLIGYSAGTYSTSMVAYNKDGEDWLTNCEYQESLEIVGYVGMSGHGYEISPPKGYDKTEEVFLEEFAPERTLEEVRSITYVDSSDPQTLLIHGDEDKSVNIESSDDFATLLEETGVTVRYYVMEGAGHTSYTQREDFREELTSFALEVTL